MLKYSIVFLFTLILIISFSKAGFSQSKAPDSVRTEAIFRIEVITPGLSYEAPLTSKSTIRAKLSGFSIARSIVVFTQGKSGFNEHLYPLIDIQYRQYINLTKRARNGQAYLENSGNYIAIKSMAVFPDTLDSEHELQNHRWIGPVYGIQRSIGSVLSLDLASGLGYLRQADDTDHLFPLITINMACTIGSK